MQPKKRQSKARQAWRRSHDALKAPHVGYCPRCNAPKKPHGACSRCGYVNPHLSLPVEQES